MRHALVALSIAAALSLACSRSEEAKTPAGSEAATPEAAAPETGTEPVAAAPPAAEIPVGNNGFDYTCADGSKFNAKIDRGNALVTIDGKTSTLAPEAGASGAQFSGEGLTFIARGDEATLVREGQPAQTCKSSS